MMVHTATVASALGVSRNDGKRNQQGRACKEGEGSKAHGSESPSRRYERAVSNGYAITIILYSPEIRSGQL
jgi:hypothetical protein